MNVLRNKNTAIVVRIPTPGTYLSRMEYPVIDMNSTSLWTGGSAGVVPWYHLFSLSDHDVGGNILFSIHIKWNPSRQHAWRDL